MKLLYPTALKIPYSLILLYIEILNIPYITIPHIKLIISTTCISFKFIEAFEISRSAISLFIMVFLSFILRVLHILFTSLYISVPFLKLTYACICE